MRRPLALPLTLAAALLALPDAMAQKAEIAQRGAINPGLGPVSTDVTRDSPRAAWESFLRFAARGQFALAAHLFDLTEVPREQQKAVGTDVARKLFLVLEALGVDRSAVADSTPEGPAPDGVPHNVVVAARFSHPSGTGEVWLRRTRDATTGELAWLFTRQTVSSIPFWYRSIVEGSDGDEVERLNPGLGEPPPSVQRGNPRATVVGFLCHAKGGDFVASAHYLDLGDYPTHEQAEVGRRLARRLMLVLLRTGVLEPSTVSNDQFGAPEVGVSDDEEVLGEIMVANRPVKLTLTRHVEPALGTVWTFSRITVSSVDALYREHGYGWIGDHLPEVFFSKAFAGLQLWQWCALVLIVGLGWGVARLLSGLLLRVMRMVASRSRVTWDDEVVRTLDGPLGLFMWAVVVALVSPLVGMSVPVQALVRRGWRLLMLAGIGWVSFRSIDLLGTRIRRAAVARSSLGQGFIPIVGRVMKVLTFVLVLLASLDVIGVRVVGLLAGLGLGGLAVAFAAQKTLENLFGAVAIAGDRPFKVGDWVSIGGVTGTVEDVGLRSTRIRPLDRTLVSIPNGVLVGQTITNFAERDRILFNTTIGLVYGTTADQIVYVLDEIKRMLLGDPRIYQDSMRVRFVGFGQSSLDIQIMCWVLTTDFHTFTGIAEELNLRIMRIVEQAGTSFAFPTHTIHFARDEAPDPRTREAIRAEVDRRRAEGVISVPEPPEELRRTLSAEAESSPGGP